MKYANLIIVSQLNLGKPFYNSTLPYRGVGLATDYREKLKKSTFSDFAANQKSNARTFSSKPLEIAGNTAMAAIKKRLDKIFLTNEYVLAWASFKPTGHALSHKLEKTMALDPWLASSQMQTIENNNKGGGCIIAPHTELAAQKNESDYQLNTLKISKTSFSKNVLNNYCSNVTLPIVGCGIDLLAFHEPYSLTTVPTVPNDKAKAPALTLTKVGAKGREQTERNYDELLRTHRVAYFLKQVLETSDLQEKWHSNQLLGAFVRNKKCVNLIASSELKQALILQQTLKKSPELTAIQPFVKAIQKFKYAHSVQAKCISSLFLKLTSIIDYRLKQVSNNISETSLKNNT